MAVNKTTWRKLPIAPRDTPFDADDAIVRISAWAKGSSEKYAQPFLWQNSKTPANNKNSYRLPIADIVNGRMVLIPHAVFTAASIMSGAHGGLEETVQSEQERREIKAQLTEMYDKLRESYGDRRLQAPWLKGRTPQEQQTVRTQLGVTSALEGFTAARKKRTKYVRDSKGRFAETPSAGAQLMQQLSENARSDQQALDRMNLRGRIELFENQKLLSSKPFNRNMGAKSNAAPVMAIIHDSDEGRELRFDMAGQGEERKWTGDSPTSISTNQRGIDEFRRNSNDLNFALAEYQEEFSELIDDVEKFGGFDDPTTLDLKPDQMRKVEQYWDFADDGTFQEGTLMTGYDGEVKYRIYGDDSGTVGIQTTTVPAGEEGDFDWNGEGVADRSSFYNAEEWDAFVTETDTFFKENERIDPDRMPAEEFYEEGETPSAPGPTDPDFEEDAEDEDEEDFSVEQDLTDESLGQPQQAPASTALTGRDALNAPPAKLKRAPGGHQGDYTGEELDAPEGAGSVRALSEYEGVEYVGINGFMRNPEPKRDPGLSEEQWAKRQEAHEKYAQEQRQRIGEIKKTMAVSKLPQPIEVDRVVKDGHAVWGKSWYGDVIDWDADFDTQDKQFEEWEAGKRPNLTGMKWREKSFSSTSAKRDLNKRYSRWAKSPTVKSQGEPTIMTLQVPAGIGGIQLSEWEAEAEVLLQDELDMEVIKDNGVDAEGFRRLIVRVVPASEQEQEPQ